MITGNEPATPTLVYYNEEGEMLNVYQPGATAGQAYGLTLRQAFAMAAMQGLLAQSPRALPASVFAEQAVICADALIEELNKNE